MSELVQDINEYCIRQAREEDRDFLLEWANDPEVRKNSFSKKRITKREHEEWFSKMLNDNRYLLFILLQNGVPVGQCRLEIHDNGDAEISYSVDRKQRGKKLGTLLIKLVKNEVVNNYPFIKRLVGRVKPDNYPSIISFANNSFREEYKTFVLSMKSDSLRD